MQIHSLISLFLVVVFFNVNTDLDNHEGSEIVLKHLELIDDDCSDFGIELVKMSDHLMAKKYGVRNLPGLVFFRKGKHLQFKGIITCYYNLYIHVSVFVFCQIV